MLRRIPLQLQDTFSLYCLVCYLKGYLRNLLLLFGIISLIGKFADLRFKNVKMMYSYDFMPRIFLV